MDLKTFRYISYENKKPQTTSSIVSLINSLLGRESSRMSPTRLLGLAMIASAFMTFTLAFECGEKGFYNVEVFHDNYTGETPNFEGAEYGDVAYRFRFIRVIDIDDKAGTLSMLMFMVVTWTDTEAIRTPNCQGKVSDDAFDILWKPDFKFHDSKEAEFKPKPIPITLNNLWVNQALWVEWYFDLSVTVYCDFDFSQYPMDTQKCKFRVSTPDYTTEQLTNTYYNYGEFNGSVFFKPEDQRSLHYDFKVVQMPENETAMPWDPEHDCTNKTVASFNCFSAVGFDILLERRMTPFLLNIYMPCTILVIVSWISFMIDTETVPARMGLLVTIFLVLTNVANGARAHAPGGGKATNIDVWLQVCQAFVACALFEYAFLLFFTRREKYKKAVEADDKTKGQTPKVTPLGRMLEDLEEEEEKRKDRDLIKITDDIALLVFPAMFTVFVVIYAASVS